MNVKSYLEWAEKKMGITSPEDWFTIDHAQINLLKGSTLIGFKYNGLKDLLTKFYPQHAATFRAAQQRHKGQRNLIRMLKKIFKHSPTKNLQSVSLEHTESTG
jgi:hypothetical protein